MTHPKLRNSRSLIAGSVYAVAGAAPGQPTAILAADCTWIADERFSGAAWLRPQAISFVSGFHGAADAPRIRHWISVDRSRRPNLRQTLVIADTSQNPALGDQLEELHDNLTEVSRVYLSGADRSPHDGGTSNGTRGTVIGCSWLVGWFDGAIAKVAPLRTKHGLPFDPDGTVISFADFHDTPPPGARKRELTEALSSATTLRQKEQHAGADVPIDLTPKELLSAATMLAVFGASEFSPGGSHTPWSDPLPYHFRGGV